jgi:hypothetical protein
MARSMKHARIDGADRDAHHSFVLIFAILRYIFPPFFSILRYPWLFTLTET